MKPRWPVLEPEDSWRSRSLEERGRGVEIACRAAVQLVAAAPDAARRLAHQDPVPASTRALLRRLAARG